MTKHSDSFFQRADDHTVCQDFAVASSFEELTFAIVSDGCSSAPHSDLGAHLMTAALSQYVWEGCNFSRSYAMAAGHVNGVRSTLGLPTTTMYATLLLACSDGNNLQSALQGDGFVVARRKSGLYDVIHHEMRSKPAPYYPAYWTDYDDSSNYSKKFADIKMIKDQYLFDPQTGLLNSKEVNVELDYIEPTVYTFPAQDYDMVTVFSDGLAGFYTGTPEDKKMVSLGNVCKELLNFKGINGAFIQRRMQFFFKRVADLRWRTADDFSCGAVSHAE